MRNLIKKNCGKQVYSTWETVRKSCVRLSTLTVNCLQAGMPGGVKLCVIRKSIPLLFPQISPLILTTLPLSEHYFYPVSTVPTISTTKKIF
jgi:hypothetical protein